MADSGEKRPDKLSRENEAFGDLEHRKKKGPPEGTSDDFIVIDDDGATDSESVLKARSDDKGIKKKKVEPVKWLTKRPKKEAIGKIRSYKPKPPLKRVVLKKGKKLARLPGPSSSNIFNRIGDVTNKTNEVITIEDSPPRAGETIDDPIIDKFDFEFDVAQVDQCMLRLSLNKPRLATNESADSITIEDSPPTILETIKPSKVDTSSNLVSNKPTDSITIEGSSVTAQKTVEREESDFDNSEEKNADFNSSKIYTCLISPPRDDDSYYTKIIKESDETYPCVTTDHRGADVENSATKINLIGRNESVDETNEDTSFEKLRRPRNRHVEDVTEHSPIKIRNLGGVKTKVFQSSETNFKRFRGYFDVSENKEVLYDPEPKDSDADDIFKCLNKKIPEHVIPKVSVTLDDSPTDIRHETNFTREGGPPNSNIEQIRIDSLEVPLVTDKRVFRFYWLYAFEEPDRHPGVVFLFGKTFNREQETYLSCCVIVKNIDRQLFVLPRSSSTDEDVYLEVKEMLMKPLKLETFKSRMVQRKYAFDPAVPEESKYLEVRYSYKSPEINANKLEFVPKTFSKIFGATTTALDRLLLEKRIKGPCWLDISNPKVDLNTQTYCQYEVNSDFKDVLKLDEPIPPPPLIVSAINIAHYFNPKSGRDEILMMSCVTQTAYNVHDKNPHPPFDHHFGVLTRPPTANQNLNLYQCLEKYKGTRLQKLDTEKALINHFIGQLSKIDPDFIIGHNLKNSKIELLVNRFIKLRVFKKFSRMTRWDNRKLRNELFTGRIVCDVKASAKELIKARSYSLNNLSLQVLKIPIDRIEPREILAMYQTEQDLFKLITHTMQETACILQIAFNLNVLPVALQITSMAGNQMSQTLMGFKSERNEYLLMHAFHERGFIVPDKSIIKQYKLENKPDYKGGLVLDALAGFYDKPVLLMDFNSLYPSIIQEYNICFTSGDSEGILPQEMTKLVDTRRQLKVSINNPALDPDLRKQYDVKQTALKLTANSLYGCLGYRNSRFYRKDLAALVTQKGREILTNTKQVVEQMGYVVIYGDTDSIMVNTEAESYEKAIEISEEIKREINKLYKRVELDLDAVFKYLLLVKKKKYAAISLSKTSSGDLKEDTIYKGLELIRNDWSELACQASKIVLGHILSDRTNEERINNIYSYLKQLKWDLENNKISREAFAINKQLSKDLKYYQNGDQSPHVRIALRMKQNGETCLRKGDSVAYVICDDGSSKRNNQRAYGVLELTNNPHLKIDVRYYLEKQIYPVVTRICGPLIGIEYTKIAQCLGLDLESFKKPFQKSEEDPTGLEFITNPKIRYQGAENFVFKCLRCQSDNVVDGPLRGDVPVLEKCANPGCHASPVEYLYSIQNQLSLTITSFINKYYKNVFVCKNPMCFEDVERVSLKLSRATPSCPLCNKELCRSYCEKDLFTQLSFFSSMFDPDGLNEVGINEQLKHAYQQIFQTAQKYLLSSGYGFIDLAETLGDIFSKLNCLSD